MLVNYKKKHPANSSESNRQIIPIKEDDYIQRAEQINQ